MENDHSRYTLSEAQMIADNMDMILYLYTNGECYAKDSDMAIDASDRGLAVRCVVYPSSYWA